MAPKERKFNPVLDHAKKQKQKLKKQPALSSKLSSKPTIQGLRDQILHLNQLASSTQLNKHQLQKKKTLQQQLDDLMFKNNIFDLADSTTSPLPTSSASNSTTRLEQDPLSPLLPHTNLSFIRVPEILCDRPSEIYQNLSLPETIHTAKNVQVVIASDAVLNKRRVDMNKSGLMIPMQVAASKEMDLEYKKLMQEVDLL